MDITKMIQIDMKAMMVDCCCLACEAGDIVKAYWSTEAQSTVSGLSNDTDPATYETALTKAEYLAGITMAEELEDMFLNEAVTTGDYAATSNKLIYGSAETPVKLNEATEEIGKRLKAFAENLFKTLGYARKILQVYSANEVGDMIADLDAHRKIPGSNMVQYELNAGITFAEQFKKFMSNEAVTQGDYASIVSLWQNM